MSTSTHQIKVKANDQTAGAFASIQKRAQTAGVNIRRMLGGALAAAGGYLGVRAFVNGVDTLGKMSDVAMKASTSVDELTKASTAFSILGIQGMGIERIAQSFALMAKNTGRTGLSGFYETIGELGKISDISKRSEAAMKVFGKAGIEFMPMINAAKDGTDALQTLIDAMPKVPQAAADVGDKLSDAKTIGVEGFRNLWLEAIGKISGTIDEQFKGGIREAAMDGVSYFTYFAKMSYARISWLFNAIGILAGAISANWNNVLANLQTTTEAFLTYTARGLKNISTKFLDWSGISEFVLGHKINVTKGNSTQPIKDAGKNLWESVGGDFIEDEFQKLVDKEDELRQLLETQLKKNEAAAEAYNKAAISTGERKTSDGLSLSNSSKSKIDNKLILGGSNEATKLALLGPQTQQEMKKQTNILTEIRDNTRQTATNTNNAYNDDFKEVN